MTLLVIQMEEIFNLFYQRWNIKAIQTVDNSKWVNGLKMLNDEFAICGDEARPLSLKFLGAYGIN